MFLLLFKIRAFASCTESGKDSRRKCYFTVGFTHAGDSPLKEYSDCVIEVEDDNPLDDRNMKPTLYFAKTMMMIELLIYEYYRISIK